MKNGKKQGFFNELATLPWPAAVIVGLVAFLLIRYALPAILAGSSNTYLQALASAAGSFAPLAWMLLVACWFTALMSYTRARHDRRLLETRTELESLAALGWKEFERLVGEAFRREGHVVEATGLGGADGGIDLILYRNGRRTLVQCKQWKRRSVPVSVVREMYGLLIHHRADEVRIVALGGFTPDAAQFAAGKPMALVDGTQLLAMIQACQTAGIHSTENPLAQPQAATADDRKVVQEPECPQCGSRMLWRTNGRTGQHFWGCSTFPRCRGTRPAQ